MNSTGNTRLLLSVNTSLHCGDFASVQKCPRSSVTSFLSFSVGTATLSNQALSFASDTTVSSSDGRCSMQYATCPRHRNDFRRSVFQLDERVDSVVVAVAVRDEVRIKLRDPIGAWRGDPLKRKEKLHACVSGLGEKRLTYQPVLAQHLAAPFETFLKSSWG